MFHGVGPEIILKQGWEKQNNCFCPVKILDSAPLSKSLYFMAISGGFHVYPVGNFGLEWG